MGCLFVFFMIRWTWYRFCVQIMIFFTVNTVKKFTYCSLHQNALACFICYTVGFYFSFLYYLFLGLTAFSAALIYTFHKKEILGDSKELTSGHFGYCFILTWVCVPLLLCSGIIYIHLRKKEWPDKESHVKTSIGNKVNKLTLLCKKCEFCEKYKSCVMTCGQASSTVIMIFICIYMSRTGYMFVTANCRTLKCFCCLLLLCITKKDKYRINFIYLLLLKNTVFHKLTPFHEFVIRFVWHANERKQRSTKFC